MVQDITKNAPNPVADDLSELAQQLGRVGHYEYAGVMGQRVDAYVNQARLHLVDRDRGIVHIKQAVINLRLAITCIDVMEDFLHQNKDRNTLKTVFNGLLEHADMPFMRPA